MFLQLLFNGLIAGAIYALVAAGFALIYATCRFVNFAHGTIVAAGAYFIFFFFQKINLAFAPSLLLTVALSGLLGWLLDWLIFKKLRQRKASPIILLVASVGVLILIESLILILFGADVKTIGFIKVAKGLEFLGAIITPLQIVIIVVAVLLFLFLWLFMKQSKIGRAMRAVADNKDVAQIVGISPEKIYGWSFFIGSLIAGVAGVLVGMEQNLEPTMGTHLMIKGFTGAVIGGASSVPGAVLGSFLLGLVENFGIWYLPSGYKDAIAFVILFIFLIFRPQGILGKKMNK